MSLKGFKNTILTNPIVGKEVLLKFRHKRFFWVASLYALITFSSIAFFIYIYGDLAYRASDFITWLSQASKSTFVFLTFWQFTFISIITLSFTSAAITSEKEQNTLLLLFSSQLDAKMIIFGKFITAILHNILTVLILLPVFSIIFILGGISLAEVLYSAVLVILGTSLFAAVSIFCSTLFQKSIVANVVSSISALSLVFGPLIGPSIILEILKFKKVSTIYLKDLLFFIPQHVNPVFPLVLLFEKGGITKGTILMHYSYTTIILSASCTIISLILIFLLLSTFILKRKISKQ
ncbi:ABC transporter permease [Thermodesulfobacteriota bacterium]